jgi:hypothetical protein
MVRGIPLTFAAFPSGMFRIGTTCGNGVTDPGEACDGVSATCDVDCTTPACGDGLRRRLLGDLPDGVTRRRGAQNPMRTVTPVKLSAEARRRRRRGRCLASARR